MSTTLVQAVNAALATVIDPELRRPITELGMVDSVEISDDGTVRLAVLLTIAGCPLRDTITRDSEAALLDVPGVTAVEVDLKVMTQAQRDALKEQLRGPGGERGIPFNQPGSLTKVFAVASGKGGVGKSSVTVNLACSLAAQGLRVGIVDADVYGFSVPALMGITQAPTRVDDMILPPVAYGVKVISIGMFVTGNQPVAWRGPMLHRALEQFLTDVYFGDLDVLFLDLPPGTGDIAISVAQLLPKAEILVVTTPRPPRRTSQSEPVPSPPRPGRRWLGSSRTCRSWKCPTAAGWICLAPAAGRCSPRGSVRRPARTCRCWARFRWTFSCGKAETRASPSSWAARKRPPRRRCPASQGSSRPGRGDWPG
jgi:Mrp family chromosome partitioning ATPase